VLTLADDQTPDDEPDAGWPSPARWTLAAVSDLDVR
jgi:hypothetical protein